MTATPLDDLAVISRKQSLIAADVADEAILLDVDSGYFFQLNKSAARIWSLIETPKSLAELHAALIQAFSVDPELCRSEMREFVDDMHSRGLVEIVAS